MLLSFWRTFLASISPADWRRTAVLSASLLCLLTFTTACKDDEATPAPAPAGRVVKYEVTGNYSGLMTMTHTNASGGTETINDVRLPWSLTLTLQAGVAGAVFNAGPKIGSPGVSGQTAVGRIYANGIEKGSATGTAGSDGYILSIQPPPVVF